MSKTIYLIRHSKATRDFAQLSDIDRPLTEKGCQDALQMSQIFKEQYPKVDLILTSPSVRTYASALIYSRTLNYAIDKVKLNKKIYLAGSRDLLSVINKLSNEYSSLILFGHNPGIERLMKLLTGVEHGHFATSAFAILEVNTADWNEIQSGSGKLISYRQPKESLYI
jgi:phosphohistidine phosphatase